MDPERIRKGLRARLEQLRDARTKSKEQDRRDRLTIEMDEVARQLNPVLDKILDSRMNNNAESED